MENNDYIFGLFLKDLRKKREVSTELLSQGCCDGSLIRKIESGSRKASYNLRTLMVERLGQDSSKYENVLNLSEYNEVCAREEIVNSILGNKYEDTEKLLKAYYLDYAASDKLCLQFYYEMLGMISEDKLGCFSKALQQTCMYSKLSLDSLLAPREINLVLEWAKAVGNRDYSEAISYIYKMLENKKYEPEWIVSVYPKVVLEYINCFCGEQDSSEAIREHIYMLEKVLAVQKAHKSLLMRTEVLEKLLDLLKQLDEKYGANSSGKINEYTEELRVISKISEASSEAYWRGLHCCRNIVYIGDVIKERRKMLRLSQKTLANGICDYRTVSRTEARKMSLEMRAGSMIFNKLCLPSEFQRTYIVPNDVFVFELEEKIRWMSNEGHYGEALEKLELLSRKMDMSLTVNKQFYLRNITIINWKLKNIDDFQCEQRLMDTLKLTVDVDNISYESVYLTSQEWSCVYNILLVNPSNKVCSSILQVVERKEYSGLIANNTLSLLFISLAQKNNRMGNFEKAIELVDLNICDELKKNSNPLLPSLYALKAYLMNDYDLKEYAGKLVKYI